MRRRQFITLLGGAVGAACPVAARAQAITVPRIGIIALRSSGHPPVMETISEGLRDFGYKPNEDILIEFRSADDRADRLPSLAAELASMRVDVIIAVASQAVRAAQSATRTIPIVMTGSSDPIGVGFIASLSHPGGNITGLSLQSPEASGKRLEILKEMVPTIFSVAAFWNPDDPPAITSLRETEVAAAALGLTIRPKEVRNPGDFAHGFQTAASENVSAAALLPAPIMASQASQITELAIRYRLPIIGFSQEFPKNGGLISYGPTLSSLYRRAAYYVDRILKGAAPATLPVEQPSKFDLAINLKTAHALGLTVPPTLLARADEVIE